MGSTQVVEQLLFSIVLSILTFYFDLILELFLTFCGHIGLFLESGYGSKTVLGSTHVVEQLLFSIVLSILMFNFDSILGYFFTFLGPKGLFWGLG